MVMDSGWITALARVGRVISLRLGGGGEEEVARFPLTCCCEVVDDAPCVYMRALQIIRIKVQPPERLSLCGSPKTPFKFLDLTI